MCRSLRRMSMFTAVVLLSACETQHNDFQCGTASTVTDNTIRVCDRVGEVCVCATNSCAVRDTVCDSGLKYTDEPFASHDVHGLCVDRADASAVVAHGVVALCSSPSDAGNDAAQPVVDAGSQGGGVDAGVDAS